MPDWRCERFAELDVEIAAEDAVIASACSEVPPAKFARKFWANKHPQRSHSEIVAAKCAWLRDRMAQRRRAAMVARIAIARSYR